jgi:hypothetical protein
MTASGILGSSARFGCGAAGRRGREMMVARILGIDVALKPRCKPHPGPREGLNPLAMFASNERSLYAAGIAGRRHANAWRFQCRNYPTAPTLIT